MMKTEAQPSERVLTIVEVWRQPEPSPRQYIVEGLIPAGRITSLFADGGTGKSYLALYVAVCVALGRPIFNRAVIQGPVLFVDAELDAEEFVRRSYEVARGLDLERPPEGLFYHRIAGSLADPLVMADVEAVVEKVTPVLVVLDSVMAAAFGADLERAPDTTATFKSVERWGTVLALDHVPKPAPGANLSQLRAYGSVFKYNLSRSVLQLIQAEAGGLILRQTKHNFGPKSAPLSIAMDFGADRVTFAEVPINDDRFAGIDDHLPTGERVFRVLMQYERGTTPDALAQELELSAGTVRNALTALKKAGRVEQVERGVWRVTHFHHFTALKGGEVMNFWPLYPNGHTSEDEEEVEY